MSASNRHFAVLVVAGLVLVGTSLAILYIVPQAFLSPAATCACGLLPVVTISPWLIGTGLAAVVVLSAVVWSFVSQARRTNRFVQDQLRGASVHPTYSTTTVAVDILPHSDRIFCHGLFRPRIAVGAQAFNKLSASEQQAVIAHETAHAQQFDPLRLYIVVSLTRLLGRFGRPLHRAFETNLELDADTKAVQHNGEAPLARALLQLRTQTHQAAPVPLLSVTEARIARLLGENARPKLHWPFAFALGMCALAFTGWHAASASTKTVVAERQQVMCVHDMICQLPSNTGRCIVTNRGTWCLQENPRASTLNQRQSWMP